MKKKIDASTAETEIFSEELQEIEEQLHVSSISVYNRMLERKGFNTFRARGEV